MKPLLPSALEAMRDSHLVSLDRLAGRLGLDGRIFAKLDYLLPGLSKKDRAARRVLEDARSSGELEPGQAVVELTSGNMGTGLAIACAILGHPFIAVMSEGNSRERAKMMRALGAEVELVPQSPGSAPGKVTGADLDLVDQRARQITGERRAFRADQFERRGNPDSHEDGTAREIWEQSKGTVTAFCDFVGSGGTLAGCARFLMPKGVRCYAVEPEGSEVLAGKAAERPDHPIQGGGYSKADLAHLDGVSLSGCVAVSGEEAAGMARLLARTEGIFGGYSSGANLCAAAKLLRGAERGGNVAAVICDSGLKYLSTGLWDEGVD